METIDKVALLRVRDRKVLSTRSKGKDVYYFPGGKREPGETDLEVLTREIREELTVDVLPGTAALYGVFIAQAHGKAEGVLVQMTCYTADYTGVPTPDHEIGEVTWLTSRDMERVSPVDKLILQDLLERDLID